MPPAPRRNETARLRTWVCVIAVAGCTGTGRVREGGGEALDAFQRGDFEKAEALCPAGGDLDSRLLRARLLLLRNRGKEAAEALFPVVAPYEPFGRQKPARFDDFQLLNRVYGELAAAYLRIDDFINASKVYEAMGEPVLSRKYKALGAAVPYLLGGELTETSVDLLGTDPLPHVAMGVNGRAGIFLIDTSLDELVIDRDFAKRAGLAGYGLRTNAYNVTYDESTAESVTLGRLSIRNVPVHLGRAAPIAGLRPDGAIGLALLMHFDFTLDYRRSRLTLRRPGGAVPGGLPAVLAGDHYLLVQGSVNGKAGVWIALHTAAAEVVAAASEGSQAALGGPAREIVAGPVRLDQPPLDPSAFPGDLDGAYGFPAGFLLGHLALRDRSVRLEPRSMRAAIE